MLSIYELDGNYFVVKNGMAVFQMVVLKRSTIVLMDSGVYVPVSEIDFDKAQKHTFQELKKKLL